MNEAQHRMFQELSNVVNKKGAKLLGNYTKISAPLEIVCEKGHHTFEKPGVLRSGAWVCSTCSEAKPFKNLLEVLDEMGLTYEENPKVSECLEGKFHFRIEVEDKSVLLIVDSDEDLTKLQEVSEQVRAHDIMKKVTDPGYRVFRIHSSMVENKAQLQDFFWSVIEGDQKICVSDRALYQWIEKVPSPERKSSDIKIESSSIQPRSIPSSSSSGTESMLPAPMLKLIKDPNPNIPPEFKFPVEPTDEIIRAKTYPGQVLGYCRVSTSDQVSGHSLESQEAMIKNYAGFKGFRVKQIFRDEGISGKEITTAPDYWLC